MKGDRIGKQVVTVFIVVLLAYGLAFTLIEHLRHRKGGWEFTFKTDARGFPSLEIAQGFLNISNVIFSFETAAIPRADLSETIVFDGPKTNVPFGRVLFFDTTFLPGTVVLDCFGHIIEVLPRTLVVNLQERPWMSGQTIRLAESDKAEPEKVQKLFQRR